MLGLTRVKRQKTPGGTRREGGGQLPAPPRHSGFTGKIRRFPGTPQNQGRASAWRKEDGAEAEGEEEGAKEGRREAGGTRSFMDDIHAGESAFPAAVSLAEINRKLGNVLWKPVQTSKPLVLMI